MRTHSSSRRNSACLFTGAGLTGPNAGSKVPPGFLNVVSKMCL